MPARTSGELRNDFNRQEAKLQTINTIGGNLFAIAATELGSALQWINIARTNGLKDPILSGQTQIVIPDFSAAFSDGIGPQ
jgi:hypothetical protein